MRCLQVWRCQRGSTLIWTPARWWRGRACCTTTRLSALSCGCTSTLLTMSLPAVEWLQVPLQQVCDVQTFQFQCVILLICHAKPLPHVGRGMGTVVPRAALCAWEPLCQSVCSASWQLLVSLQTLRQACIIALRYLGRGWMLSRPLHAGPFTYMRSFRPHRHMCRDFTIFKVSCLCNTQRSS